MELKDLYRDVILDHNRQPRNFGKLDPADAQADGHNPLCGDRLTVSVRLSGDTITDIRFEGKGCAISTASASLMTEAVKGRNRNAVHELFGRVHALLTQAQAPSDESLGKLASLSGVREFPSRVKCASLCWHTLNAALDQGGTISTEAGNESSAEGAL
jgi:nitrogen fixation protein NifU and related proteins